MNNKISVEETKEKSKRIFRFGYTALFVMLMNATLDLIRDLPVSAILLFTMVILISVILLVIYLGNSKGAIASIVISVNIFLVLIAFAEGLNTGGYLFILSLLFALPFLMSSFKIAIIEIAAYFFITACSFCVCILFCSEKSKWQNISGEMYTQMFMFNSICVAFLCTIFAYMGIHFELKYQAALLDAKNKAEKHEQRIQKQNDHLQDIAFMNAHIVRSPLANILALTDLIDIDKIADKDNKEIITLLQTSAQLLDDNIREIVTKASDKEAGLNA